MLLATVTGPSPFWFITRATGAVSLVLLTLSVTLGIVNVRRTQIAGVPRFVMDSVHRTASLLAVAFVVVHIVTTLMDGYAPISLLDVVVPFGSAYRPVWLGLGTVAFDLLIAITITSLLRRRLGHRPWRAMHWLAYASWPVALVHGLGTGSDAKTQATASSTSTVGAFTKPASGAAHVSDARDSTLSLVAHLQISPGPGTASGTVTATPEVS